MSQIAETSLIRLPDVVLGAVATFLGVVDLHQLCSSCRELRRRRGLLLEFLRSIETHSPTDLAVLEHFVFPQRLTNLQTLDFGSLATDHILQVLSAASARVPKLKTISMVGSLDLTDVGLHSLSFAQPFAGSLVSIDITYCHNTTYAGTFLLRDHFPNLVIRRIPTWMEGQYETPFENDGLHTYYADGSFEFERSEQSCGYVIQVDKWFRGNPFFVFDKLQYSNFALPQLHSVARFVYRPGVSLLRLNDSEVLVGQTLRGLRPPLRYPRLEHAQLMPEPKSSVYFNRSGNVVDGLMGRYYMVSRMRKFPLTTLMPPDELVQTNREFCNQMADARLSAGTELDPMNLTAEAALENILHRELGGE